MAKPYFIFVWEISFREWGRKMQDDITEGVEYLKKEGIADPARIAIYGASYGGYATLAGVTKCSIASGDRR